MMNDHSTFHDLVITDFKIIHKFIIFHATYPDWNHRFEFILMPNGLIKAKNSAEKWAFLSNEASGLLSTKVFRTLA